MMNRFVERWGDPSGLIVVALIFLALWNLDVRYRAGATVQLQDDMQSCLVWREGRP